MNVSVIIVTWNCADLLTQCLNSLRSQVGLDSVELLVVDNASADGSAERARAEWPGAVVIANDVNRGFAVASNQGLAHARGDLLLLLNPDTILPAPDTLARVVQRMRQHPQLAMVGVRLVFADGRHQVGDGGYAPTLTNSLAHAFGLSQFVPGCRGVFLQDKRARVPWEPVDWICGAFTAVTRTAYERGGGLDEGYFLYGEDIEWGCRWQRQGLPVAYFPDIGVIHLQGGTQRKSGQAPGTRWIDGLSKLFWRYNRGRYFDVFRYGMAAGFYLRALIAWPLKRQRAATMAAYARSFRLQRAPQA